MLYLVTKQIVKKLKPQNPQKPDIRQKRIKLKICGESMIDTGWLMIARESWS